MIKTPELGRSFLRGGVSWSEGCLQGQVETRQPAQRSQTRSGARCRNTWKFCKLLGRGGSD